MAKRKRRNQKNKIDHAPNSEPSLAEGISATATPEQRVNQVLSQAHFTGPIPHPEIFKSYGEIVPDAPERILTVFERDSQAARDLPIKAIEAQKEDNRRAALDGLELSYIGLCVKCSIRDDG